MTNASEVDWGALRTGSGTGRDLPSLLDQLTSVDESKFGKAQKAVWQLLGAKDELFDALPPFVECLLTVLERPVAELTPVHQARLLRLTCELFAQGTGDKVAIGFAPNGAKLQGRYESEIGRALRRVMEARLPWFETLLSHEDAALRAAGLIAIVFCTPATERSQELAISMAKQELNETVRGLATHCLGPLSRQLGSSDGETLLSTLSEDEHAPRLLRVCALTGTLSVAPGSTAQVRRELVLAGMIMPGLDNDLFPIKGGSLAELLYECVCEATQGVEFMRGVYLELAMDQRLIIERRRAWFEEIFRKTLPKPRLGYALAEDFDAEDLRFLGELSKQDYMAQLHYPPVYSNPFHWVGVPAGLRARRRWLELDSGGPMTRRVEAVTQGIHANWTVWRHLLGCVDKDGDTVPKLQLEFVKQHLGPLATLELLCDDVGANDYDERMIWGAQEFAVKPAESLASKAGPEVVEWATQRIAELERLEGEQLASLRSRDEGVFVLAPLAKSLRKGQYLPSNWAKLMDSSSLYPKLTKQAWGGFDGETKVAYLSTVLSPWLAEPSEFFDPANGFPKVLSQLRNSLEYFCEPLALATLARFCQALYEADSDAAKRYLIPSEIPHLLLRAAAAGADAAQALQPYRTILDQLGGVEPGPRLSHYYQAHGTRHVDVATFDALDDIGRRQLETFGKKVYGLASAEEVLRYWREPEHRRLGYCTKVGLLTGRTYYDLWISLEGSERRECCVFQHGQSLALSVTVVGEDFAATDDSPRSRALAQACESALVKASPEDSFTVSWRAYWGLEPSSQNVLPSPAPGIPGAIRITERAKSAPGSGVSGSSAAMPRKDSRASTLHSRLRATPTEVGIARVKAKKTSKKASSRATKKVTTSAPAMTNKASTSGTSKASKKKATKKSKTKASK